MAAAMAWYAGPPVLARNAGPGASISAVTCTPQGATAWSWVTSASAAPPICVPGGTRRFSRAPAITPQASARLNLRVPPGMLVGDAAEALVSHLHAVAPWGVHVTAEIEAPGPAFLARTGGPAHQAIAAAMQEAYGRPMATLGDGGSIPLCNVLAGTYPDAELILMGVEEPLALIHAPNESVDPAEIAAMALTEALFLQRYAAGRG